MEGDDKPLTGTWQLLRAVPVWQAASAATF